MEESKVNSAVEDIKTIKEVIENSGKSVWSFGKLSILWGIIFIANSIVGIIMMSNPEPVKKFFVDLHPTLGYLFPLPLIILLAVLAYFYVAKVAPLTGLEKKLTAIWTCLIGVIVLSNLIPQTFSLPEIMSDGSTHVTVTKMVISISSPISVFIFSLGLFITSLLTSYKQFRVGAFLYLLLGIISLYSDSLRQLLVILVLPVTFLYLGIYLWVTKHRSDRREHQSNT